MILNALATNTFSRARFVRTVTCGFILLDIALFHEASSVKDYGRIMMGLLVHSLLFYNELCKIAIFKFKFVKPN